MKAFNTIFRHVLEKGRPDVFIAGDDAQAKAVPAEPHRPPVQAVNRGAMRPDNG